MKTKLNVGVIADWERAARGDVWDDVLKDVESLTKFDIETTTFHLADLIVAPPVSGGLVDIRKSDVLVVNWDAANGDPDFGAHLAQRWLDHRRRELLIWVKNGGILIVESQATLGVPTQDAYNAVVGAGELPVSGPVSDENPENIRERMGNECQKTKRFPKVLGFENVDDVISAGAHVSHEVWFPGPSTALVTEHIKDLNEGRQLYRGWFRRFSFQPRALPWVSLMKTRGRGWGVEHSTLQVAKIGEGAIFASTMNISMTRRVKLIAALLNCKGDVEHLPEPHKVYELLQKYWKLMLTGLGGGLAIYVARWSDPWAHRVALQLGHGIAEREVTAWTNDVKIAFVPLGVALLALLHFATVRLLRFWRDYMGY